MIAASALEHRMTLVTHNISDFAHMGLQLLDPFAG
jgi:predicted nucleic acid-binding protein